jgi:hypothetical protein
MKGKNRTLRVIVARGGFNNLLVLFQVDLEVFVHNFVLKAGMVKPSNTDRPPNAKFRA